MGHKGMVVSIVAVVAVFVAVFLSNWARESRRIRYIKSELKRVHTLEEKRHWRRELRIVRWCLVLSITYEHAKSMVLFFERRRRK